MHSDFLYKGGYQGPAKGQTHSTDSVATHRHKQGPFSPRTCCIWRNLRVIPLRWNPLGKYLFRGVLHHGADAISSLKDTCLDIIPFDPDKMAADRMEEGFYPHFSEDWFSM